MKRLTTNDANHILAPLNLFYAENQEVMVRGGGPEPDYADTTLVELVRRIAKTHDLSIEAESPESLGDEMYEAMFDGVDTVEGVVALLHAAAVQAAEMRGRLEMIENILDDEYDLDRLREMTQVGQVRTNADRIRGMSDEELGKFLYGYFWGRLHVLPNREEKLLEWLQQPAEGEN